MLKREVIGKGCEHTVYKSKNDGWVLKTPNWAVIMCGYILRQSAAELIRHEVQIGKGIIQGTDVVIPTTRVFQFGRHYIIAQKFIEDDASIADMSRYLEEHGNKELYTAYQIKKDNFITHQRTAYWIDPTFGFTRLPDTLGIMDHKKCNQLKAWVLKVIKLNSHLSPVNTRVSYD